MVELIIDHVGAQGDGVAVVGDHRIYVPGTLAGERVNAAVTGARARVTRVLSPSPDRVDPPCPHFGACGGCVLQHMATDSYGRWKSERVARALSQRGFGNVPLRALAKTPPHSRRRARLTAVRTKGDVVLGYNRRHSRQVVSVALCPVLRPQLAALLTPLRSLLKTLMRPAQRGTVHATETESGVDLVLDLPGEPDLAARQRLAEFAGDHDLARISWGADPEPVVERCRPTMVFDGVGVALPPGGFVQASAAAEQVLVAEVCTILGQAQSVADLFSGLGTFTFPLARRARVVAFDGEGSAIGALAAAAGGRAVEARVRDLFRRPLAADELARFDGVLMDPPRAGARAQAEQLARSPVPTVAMVSCNPATFARDARILVDGGYSLEWVQPVDQFLWSAEVELVASFRRG